MGDSSRQFLSIMAKDLTRMWTTGVDSALNFVGYSLRYTPTSISASKQLCSSICSEITGLPHVDGVLEKV
jgi:hypothetical protein